MANELGKSPYLTVLSDARMSQTLRLMVRPADTKFTADVASEICERTESIAAVEGSITGLGSEYVLGLRAKNCRNGEILDEEQASAGAKENVFKALGQMASRFQNQAGELIARIPREPSLPIEVTTPSLEAWRSYKAALMGNLRGSNQTGSIVLDKRAIEADPNFAMAYAYMGRSFDAIGESEQAARNISKAYELRDRVSDPENFFITFNYYRQVPRNLELARQTLESWVRKYPGDLNPHGFYAAFTCDG